MYDEGAGSELRGNVAGNIRRLAKIESPQLGNRRDVLVYLPPSYVSSGRHYPVLYMPPWPRVAFLTRSDFHSGCSNSS